jgi:hypothetical protein
LPPPFDGMPEALRTRKHAAIAKAPLPDYVS